MYLGYEGVAYVTNRLEYDLCQTKVQFSIDSMYSMYTIHSYLSTMHSTTSYMYKT